MIVGYALEEAYLPTGMQDAASERPVKNRTAMRKAGKMGADLLLLPVDFVPEQGADRAELAFDGLVVEFGGVQPRHERGRAELMTREMNGDASHTRGATPANENGSRGANANSRQCEPPVVLQPDHPLPPEAKLVTSCCCRLSARRHNAQGA
jgi:hypothetical protein